MPARSSVVSPGIRDGGSVSSVPRPWPERPTPPPDDGTACGAITRSIAANSDSQLTPGRAAASPASVASQATRCASAAAASASPTAQFRSKSQKWPSQVQPVSRISTSPRASARPEGGEMMSP